MNAFVDSWCLLVATSSAKNGVRFFIKIIERYGNKLEDTLALQNIFFYGYNIISISRGIKREQFHFRAEVSDAMSGSFSWWGRQFVDGWTRRCWRSWRRGGCLQHGFHETLFHLSFREVFKYYYPFEIALLVPQDIKRKLKISTSSDPKAKSGVVLLNCRLPAH